MECGSQSSVAASRRRGVAASGQRLSWRPPVSAVANGGAASATSLGLHLSRRLSFRPPSLPAAAAAAAAAAVGVGGGGATVFPIGEAGRWAEKERPNQRR